jgi:hypothetical protein
MPVRSVSTAPTVQEKVAEEYYEMRRLRDHYGPGLCRPGTNNVFESSEVGTIWFAGWLPEHRRLYTQSLLGRAGTQFRFGTLDPATHGRVVYRARPICSVSDRHKATDPMYSKPVVVARELEEGTEIGVGISLRRANFRWQYPEEPFFGTPRLPFRTYDERSSERIGVAALTLTTKEGAAPIIRVRTIAGEGYDLFDEDEGGRVVRAYEANVVRSEAIVNAFHQAYWESVCEPA